jgi:hypothetical protein
MLDDFDKHFDRTRKMIGIGFVINLIITIVIIAAVIALVVFIVGEVSKAGGLIPLFRAILGK